MREIIRNLLFADDCALTAHSQDDMREIMNRFASSANRCSLKVSLSKTVLLHQPVRQETQSAPVKITVYNTDLAAVEQFCYLGSELHRDCTIDSEVTARLAKAGAVFGKLVAQAFREHGISLKAKVNVYRACVLSTLLCAVSRGLYTIDTCASLIPSICDACAKLLIYDGKTKYLILRYCKSVT